MIFGRNIQKLDIIESELWVVSNLDIDISELALPAMA